MLGLGIWVELSKLLRSWLLCQLVSAGMEPNSQENTMMETMGTGSSSQPWLAPGTLDVVFSFKQVLQDKRNPLIPLLQDEGMIGKTVKLTAKFHQVTMSLRMMQGYVLRLSPMAG